MVVHMGDGHVLFEHGADARVRCEGHQASHGVLVPAVHPADALLGVLHSSAARTRLLALGSGTPHPQCAVVIAITHSLTNWIY